MFVSIFNLWIGFFFVTAIFSIYIFFYFNIFGGFTEIKWKFFYFIIGWLITFCYLFFEIEIILQQFSFQLGDFLILKDLQDLITISIDLAFWLSCWFILPLLFFYFWSFFFTFWTQQEKMCWILFFFLIFYFLSLFKILLDYDLFLACWTFFKKAPQTFFDFQPDFLYIIFSYLGDFNDLSKFFGVLMCLFFFIFLFQGNISYYYAIPKIFYSRILFSLCFSGSLFYFFGGESFLRDCFLILISIFFCELYYFIYLFLYILKCKKFI